MKFSFKDIAKNIPLRFVLAAAVFILISVGSKLKAAELVMFEQQYCSWCEAWHEEIGGIYGKTAEGKRAPLRRVDIDDPLPKEFNDIEPTVYTPTFVLWEDGKEVARLRGYPGDEYFWFLLGEMLEKLPNSDTARTN